MRSLLLTSLFACLCFFTTAAQCPPAKTSGVHIVQKGETLYSLSRKYNVTVDQLRQWNNLPSDALAICQELRVKATAPGTSSGTPTTTPPVYPKQSGPTHIVQRGETVASIARMYGFTEARFRKFNNLKPGQEVAQGTVLKSDDCQCPQLTQSSGEPIVSYDFDVPVTSPSSMFSEQQRITQPTGQPNNTKQTVETSQPGATESSFVSAEDLLVERKKSAVSSFEKPVVVPVVTPGQRGVVAPYMTDEERSMIDEINLVRTNPVGYIPAIEDFKKDIQAGWATGSVEACDELIAEMKSMKPTSLLEPAECMYNVSRKHGEDLRNTGMLSHKGSDSSWPWDRVKRACLSMKDGNELLVGGTANVRRALVTLLVDSNIPSRGHRRILLNPGWTHAASYKAGQVGPMDHSWVLLFGQ